MKIIKMPFETIVKCKRCECEFEYDADDVFLDIIRVENIQGLRENVINLSVKCPVCGLKCELQKKVEE